MKQQYSVEVEDLGITIASGSIARQANGAVTIVKGETTVLVTATVANSLKPDQDWFPLSVDYRDKFAAAGRFPGGYFKREGRPTEKEILTSRLCDRPLRPLFPTGFINEVQVLGYLLSTDLMNEPDVLMVNGASAAVYLSDIPWNGPIGCVRVGEINGQFVANPTNEEQFESRLDLVYVGNERDMMMIEGSADQIPEARFIEALEFAHAQVQKVIAAIKKLHALGGGKTKRVFKLQTPDPKVLELCTQIAGNRLSAAMHQDKKQDRESAVHVLIDEAKKSLEGQLGAAYDKNQVRLAFEVLQEKVYRENILVSGKRVDGRGPQDLRAISCEVGVLPRVHGSALFQRGETQGLVITTLGTSKDSQEMDGITGGARSKSFILHYNFPPFSVGETGRTGSPGRREIGHGALAERSLLPIIPPEDEFPYSVRLVSEIMESNGSTSMASVCGGCLSLMDAGVPILAPVAGISVGLVSRESNGQITEYKILTDIIGAEDHFGDMDFKVCGTREGITGFQLDLKIHGLPLSIAKEAIAQNKEARLKILDIMQATQNTPRSELRECAPRIVSVKIDPEKIGMLIGPGGKNIKRIVEVSGAQIDINEDNSGRVNIFSNSKESLERAKAEIEAMTAEIELGKTYKGIVRSIKEFGAFVECLPGKEGLVHVSEMADFRVNRVEDVCKLGDEMLVKCIGIDDKGKCRLSRRAAILEQQGLPYTPTEKPPSRDRGDRGDRGGRGGDRFSGPPRGGDYGDRGGDRGGRGGDRFERGPDRGPDRGHREHDRGPRDQDRGPRDHGNDRGGNGGGHDQAPEPMPADSGQ
jgi:polyribonucleotide nucleotidyltransferase